tara:strand:- start:467 stop:1057 length:591 start_codon:yes stop_codon:yes gene_type:complete
MSQFDKDRFPDNYQRVVGMAASSMLHKNSEELVEILKNHRVLDSNSTVFELGSGPARNLHYIYETFKNKKLYCSDLFREASLRFMSSTMRDTVTFIEGDSQHVIDNKMVHSVDLFLVSDHFMHLQYEKADYIIKKILSHWKPKYIMLREIKKEFETPDHPRLYHNYDQFLSDYEKIEEKTSDQVDAYFIWLLKRKQ